MQDRLLRAEKEQRKDFVLIHPNPRLYSNPSSK